MHTAALVLACLATSLPSYNARNSHTSTERHSHPCTCKAQPRLGASQVQGRTVPAGRRWAPRGSEDTFPQTPEGGRNRCRLSGSVAGANSADRPISLLCTAAQLGPTAALAASAPQTHECDRENQIAGSPGQL